MNGTLILFDGSLIGGELTGGTYLTAEVAAKYGKPLLQIDASKHSVTEALEAVLGWLSGGGIKVLNVAGPRASGWSHGYEYTRQLVALLLRALHSNIARPPD